VHCITPTLHSKLAGQMGVLRGLVSQAAGRSSAEFAAHAAAAAAAGAPIGHLLRPAASGGAGGGDRSGAAAAPPPESGDLCSEDLESHAGDADVTVVGGTLSSAQLSHASARLSKVSSRQLCTEAMLKVLQQEIRKGRRRSLELSACAELVIHEAVGRGGFGSVYRGTWHSIPAAIKIMNARNSNSEAVSDAMEMAVLSSVQHPNIVQVFCCLTDMVAVEDCELPLGGFCRGGTGALFCDASGLGPAAQLLLLAGSSAAWPPRAAANPSSCTPPSSNAPSPPQTPFPLSNSLSPPQILLNHPSHNRPQTTTAWTAAPLTPRPPRAPRRRRRGRGSGGCCRASWWTCRLTT
jgi:hypothetical protein